MADENQVKFWEKLGDLFFTFITQRQSLLSGTFFLTGGICLAIIFLDNELFIKTCGMASPAIMVGSLLFVIVGFLDLCASVWRKVARSGVTLKYDVRFIMDCVDKGIFTHQEARSHAQALITRRVARRTVEQYVDWLEANTAHPVSPECLEVVRRLLDLWSSIRAESVLTQGLEADGNDAADARNEA